MTRAPSTAFPGGAVETLFLDAGGVLVEPDWPRIAAILAGHGIPVPAAALAAADPGAHRDLDRPALIGSTDDRGRAGMYYAAVLARAGVVLDRPRLDAGLAALAAEHSRWNLWSVVPAGVPESLDALRAAGLRLVVVSNADGKLAGVFEALGLARRFDRLVDSGVLGIEKPDPRIFAEALRVSGAAAATTVHVGDYYEIDVVGARAAGLRAVLIDPAGLHGDRDCPRFGSLRDFAKVLLS